MLRPGEEGEVGEEGWSGLAGRGGGRARFLPRSASLAAGEKRANGGDDSRGLTMEVSGIGEEGRG